MVSVNTTAAKALAAAALGLTLAACSGSGRATSDGGAGHDGAAGGGGSGTGGAAGAGGTGTGGGGGASGGGGVGGAAGSGGSVGAGGSAGSSGSGGADAGADATNFTCGLATCTTGQSYCYSYTPGVPGGTAARTCKPISAACATTPTCACVCPPKASGPPGGCMNENNTCSCTETNGQVVVMCLGQ